MEKKWFPFKLDHTAPDGEGLIINKATETGILSLDGLAFNIDEEKFPMAIYEIVITDVTHGIEKDWLLPPLRVDLKVLDSTPINPA